MMEDSTLKFPGLSHIFLDINPLNSPPASKFVFYFGASHPGNPDHAFNVDISTDPIDPFFGLQKMAKNTTNHVMVQEKNPVDLSFSYANGQGSRLGSQESEECRY